MKKSMLTTTLLSLVVASVLPFSAMSEDGGKKFTPEQREAFKEKMKERHEKKWQESDANGDGAIDKSEFTAQAEKRFEKMDLNGDGKVTKEEKKAARDQWKDKHKGKHKGEAHGDDD